MAATPAEAAQLVGLYGADPVRAGSSPSGVDHAVFFPRSRHVAATHLHMADVRLLLFVGRLQPHKGPDIAIGPSPRCSRATRTARRTWSSRSSAAERYRRRRDRSAHGSGRGARRGGARDAVPAPAAGQARRLLCGRRGRADALALRVVRARRARGPGVRHSGNRRRGRRPAGTSSTTGRLAISSRVTTPPTTPSASSTSCVIRSRPAGWARPAWRTRSGSRGTRRPRGSSPCIASSETASPSAHARRSHTAPGPGNGCSATRTGRQLRVFAIRSRSCHSLSQGCDLRFHASTCAFVGLTPPGAPSIPFRIAPSSRSG